MYLDVIEAVVDDFVFPFTSLIEGNLFGMVDDPAVMGSELSFQLLLFCGHLGKRRHQQAKSIRQQRRRGE